MNKMMKIFLIAGSSLLLLALVGGVLLFGMAGYASAQESATDESLVGRALAHFGRGGFPGDRGAGDEYLAEALGLSVEELQAAQEEAALAALDLAVEEGLITAEQADAMKTLGLYGFGPHGHGVRSGLVGADIDRQALLADALGITVEELQAAEQAALEARLADALADGQITEEQVELMQAQAALRAVLDPQAILAEALGISVDQLQAYRESGLTHSEILSELDLTAAEVREAFQVAHAAAVAQAVEDGVITQEQAVLLAEKDGLAGFRPGFGRGRHGGRGGFGFPGGLPGLDDLPGTTPDTPTETGLDV